ncbi:UbiA family prenyltransferase [Actinokineospora spheciospongiae]|uniref:UbiA family prenyltransferase n=1 Tax=Actinokineospora spheciospongiae TaxID=909613 RepID=UPI000D9FABE5|nr:UbiA family prenyltransferase [Actinokineospora spheciospongiae]PWW51492.1 1,4-dihydroxy-2-naphthoate octaprenyltransferase [Actinokineospora spheciospongiae]
MTTALDRATLGAYARLAKLDVWDYYLALPLAWTLVGGRGTGTLLLFGVGTVLVVAASVALDDVTGHRDGSDAANYGPDAPARRLARKPLLTGELTDAQAIRFACGCALAGGAVWLLLGLSAPLWTLVLLLVCLLSSVQYSWGLRISYRGGQEVFLAGFGTGLVLCGVGLVTGELTPLVVVEAVLFGLGPLLFGVYSNTADAAGDAAVGRRTVAVLASPAGNRAFITGLSLAEVALVVFAAGLGVGPWWFALALLPAVAVRVAQLRRGVGLGDVLRARKLGLLAHRVTVVSLIAVNLLGGAA